MIIPCRIRRYTYANISAIDGNRATRGTGPLIRCINFTGYQNGRIGTSSLDADVGRLNCAGGVDRQGIITTSR